MEGTIEYCLVENGIDVSAHLQFAWCWILLGLLAGTVAGLFFHRDDWLGGYASWPRRLARLGHIAFLGTGLLNLGFALTAGDLGLGPSAVRLAGAMLIAGAVTMPAVCYLAAWRKPFRHLFFIPVLSLLGGVGLFVVRLLSYRPGG
jgi:hypothetical protein